MHDPTDIKSICLQLLNSVLAPRSCAYASGPLDSGVLLYENPTGMSAAEIRKHNQTRLTNFTIQLRQRLTYPVIDPGLLRVSGWVGKDYGSFFLEVMEQYAKEAWFIDGWEFSYGATREFLFFTSLGRPCLNEAGENLSIQAGKGLIQDAIIRLEKNGFDASRLRLRLE